MDSKTLTQIITFIQGNKHECIKQLMEINKHIRRTWINTGAAAGAPQRGRSTSTDPTCLFILLSFSRDIVETILTVHRSDHVFDCLLSVSQP